jgi:hypothetical protein
VTVQDLRPNSQDISAFCLDNIYQVLADPNVTRSSTPSPVAKPPSFSPSRYAVWVNSLWFLSLVMNLSCALWATSLHQWARRYLRRAQPSRCGARHSCFLYSFVPGRLATLESGSLSTRPSSFVVRHSFLSYSHPFPCSGRRSPLLAAVLYIVS